MNTIRYLVVHCSDTPNYREHDAADIHRWHKKKRWTGIGYNAVIKLSGEVEHGRPNYWQGAHVRKHNNHSLGVCLIGRDKFTKAQLQSLKLLLSSWQQAYPDAHIVGHYQLDDNKSCPNIDIPQWLAAAGLTNPGINHV